MEKLKDSSFRDIDKKAADIIILSFTQCIIGSANGMTIKFFFVILQQ